MSKNIDEIKEDENGSASAVERLVMRDVSDYEKYALEEIDRFDANARDLSQKALNVRNDFLRSCGWDVSSVKTNVHNEFIDETFVYEKDDELFLCERDAIDYELYGA